MPSAALRLISNATTLSSHRPTLEHLGPATVTAVVGHEVELELSGSRRWARLAVAIAYQPRVGDSVLAIATVEDCYVIGVLEGSGPTVLNAPGDLELSAPYGSIRIAAAQDCIIASPSMRMAARELDLIGDALHEEFETVRRRVAGMLEVRAKEICTAVSETYRLVARRIVGRGEDNVTIDAPSINLG